MKSCALKVLAVVAVLAATSQAAAQSQAGMNATASAKAGAADRALNIQYRATSGRLSPAAKAKLRDAQRAWIGFRNAECAYEASAVQGGSAYPMVRSACLERLSDERTRQLKAKATCEEGDLACPR